MKFQFIPFFNFFFGIRFLHNVCWYRCDLQTFSQLHNTFVHASNTNQTENWLYPSIRNCSESSMKIKIITSTIYSFSSEIWNFLSISIMQIILSGKSFSTNLMLLAGLHCLFISAQTTLQTLLLHPSVAHGLKCHGHCYIQPNLLFSFNNSFGNESVCQEQIITLMAFGGT